MALQSFLVTDLSGMSLHEQVDQVGVARSEAAAKAQTTGKSWHVLLCDDPKSPAVAVTRDLRRRGWHSVFSARPH